MREGLLQRRCRIVAEGHDESRRYSNREGLNEVSQIVVVSCRTVIKGRTNLTEMETNNLREVLKAVSYELRRRRVEIVLA